ncbi:hypothetical protein CR513_13103, partial [Mucuna pruriens]
MIMLIKFIWPKNLGEALPLITQAPNLRSNSLQEGEDDAYMGGHTQGIQEGKNKVATHAIEGPITKGGLRVFKRKCNMSWAWSRDKRRPKKANFCIMYPIKFVANTVAN